MWRALVRHGRIPCASRISYSGIQYTMTQRTADAAQHHLEMLIGIVNDPDSTPEERIETAKKLAKEGECIWFDRNTGEPNFELAKAFAQATSTLIDPNASEAEKRKARAGLQQFIFMNGERREGADSAE